MNAPIRVTLWNEFLHEKTNPVVRELYPHGMHTTLAAALGAEGGFEIRTGTLEEPEHGLPPDILDATDVLVWWGHMAHDEVSDTVVERAAARVWQGMGLVVLHSGHFSKLFKKLMGTPCSLTWRDVGEKERLWVCNPGHPIAHGIARYFELEREEMYGEPFAIPEPDESVFISWFAGGDVFRSGCTWRRGNGKIFYFRPGHETFPTYHDLTVQRVIANGIRWVRPEGSLWIDSAPCIAPEIAAEPSVFTARQSA